VRHGAGRRYLHHNFVVALLNDLLGIQSRGGCSCAGPYGHRLLGYDLATSRAFEEEVVLGCGGIKPGWTRLNFNYFITEAVFQYLVDAVDFIATHGWKLLPDYRFEPGGGDWPHRAGRPPAARSLDELSYRSGRLEYRARRASEPEWVLPTYLDEAHKLVERAVASYAGRDPIEDPTFSERFEELRWFWLPGEILAELQAGHQDPDCVDLEAGK
jgi:hypothetical protein